jgi:hypothetical protein
MVRERKIEEKETQGMGKRKAKRGATEEQTVTNSLSQTTINCKTY